MLSPSASAFWATFQTLLAYGIFLGARMNQQPH